MVPTAVYGVAGDSTLHEVSGDAEVRFPCDLQVFCQSITAAGNIPRQSAHLTGISESGMQLALPYPVRPGEVMAVELPATGMLPPRTVRLRVTEAATEACGGWRVLCVFPERLSMRDLEGLRETLSRTSPQAPKLPPIPESAEACLILIYPMGHALGARFPLQAGPMTLGRDTGNEVPLTDPSVSRRHARIERHRDGYQVIDLQSTNGTYVNNVPVATHPLADGDCLRLGGCIFRFLAGGNVEAQYHEEIYRLSICDGLTGIPNRRFLEDFLRQDLARAAQEHRCTAFLLLDVDHFKLINDQLGHLAGDVTLQQLTQRLRAAIRPGEVFARYGGEEFAVALPGYSRAQAVELAERLRVLVAQEPFAYQEDQFQVTISVGVSLSNGAPPRLRHEELIRQADRNLYEAKRLGRNRVVA